MRISAMWRAGLTVGMDPEHQKIVTFSNGVYLIIASLLLFFEIVTGGIITLFSEFSLRSFLPFSLILLSGLCLSLNFLRAYLLSRALFLTVLSFLVSVFPIIYYGPKVSTYFTHPFIIILISPLIHLLFSQRKDRHLLLIFLGGSFLFTLFSIDFLLLWERSANPQLPFSYSATSMRINFILWWAFLNVLMAYIQKTNGRFYDSLQVQKELIARQRMELQSRNEELILANQELTALNERVHHSNEVLEHRVDERTVELTERNKTLTEYAFINAHMLRSPVSRIKGLINLFSITNDETEKKKVQEILIQSAEELDNVVHKISKKLNESHYPDA
jgi:signal transduction histidine kinase